ncbi:MAG TPA: Xaa-Pro peptidase family protein [Anaerolineaceae bacterium]|nr:Xaa-Pro peptidase family protein [Anaerolineaceae bacterium]
MSTHRLERLTDLMQSNGLDALALTPGPNLVYLAGLHLHQMERPSIAIFMPNRLPLLIVPELEAGKAAGLSVDFETFTYGDNPATWNEVYRRAAQSAGLAGKTIGIEPGRMRFLEYHFLQDAMPDTRFISAESALAALRLCKEPEEIEAMRQAAVVAQQALSATLPLVKVGMTERDLARELVLQLFRAGSDPEMPFAPIVASGPNSANPHAVPSDRKLTPGDLVIIDWGASVSGYFSDLTRTIGIGQVDAKLAHIAQVVAQANAAGRAAGKPGLPAGAVDHAARKVIDEAGFGQYFIHRTGHGLGMEAHEEPYMFGENQQVLKPGMVYTVEPGIYLPGVGGVRIEDDVAVTERASESLSNMPRDLLIVVTD